MKAVFIELPAFERHRKDYLDDDAFSRLQEAPTKQRAELKERVKGELKTRRKT